MQQTRSELLFVCLQRRRGSREILQLFEHRDKCERYAASLAAGAGGPPVTRRVNRPVRFSLSRLLSKPFSARFHGEGSCSAADPRMRDRGSRRRGNPGEESGPRSEAAVAPVRATPRAAGLSPNTNCKRRLTRAREALISAPRTTDEKARRVSVMHIGSRNFPLRNGVVAVAGSIG